MEVQSENLLLRITVNLDICHGKPTVRNMRYPVTLILDLLSAGMTHEVYYRCPVAASACKIYSGQRL